jgi:hypothetical protein
LIRAPVKLLEFQADAEDYKLQLRAEIDPGSDDFFNREISIRGERVALEKDEEDKSLDRETGTVILEKLYRAGKIAATELNVPADNETEIKFYTRIHALERVADEVPIWNKYPAYAAFSTKPELRYVFQTYPSAKGESVFRQKDRIYLTKAIIDKFFDIEMLVQQDIVSMFTVLHSANQGEALTLEILASKWVRFWEADAMDVGTPLVTHEYYEEEVPVPFFLRPYCQPLAMIREYFGEKIGLYFAWLGYYTYWLTVPAAMGIALEAIYFVRGYSDTIDHLDWFLVAYLLGMVIWNVFYKTGWEREEKAISVKWGTFGFEEAEKSRPQFLGDPEQPLKRSNITNIKETYYPEYKRRQLIALSGLQMFFLILISLAFAGAVFVAEALVQSTYTEFEFTGFGLVVCFIQALQITVGSVLFRSYARRLTDTENHRTDTEFEDALITKVLFFQMANTYGVPLFTAFGKGPLLGSCSYSSCLYDLRELLLVIFVVRFCVILREVILPQIDQAYTHYENESFASSHKEQNKLAKVAQYEFLAEEASATEILKEIEKDPFESTFNEYAQAVVQYGYITLFSVALPLLPILSLVENFIAIRLHAYAMCYLTRRPHILVAEDVGMWGDLMDMFSVLGVLSSVGIICFTDESLDEYSYLIRFIIFLIAEQAILMTKFILQFLYPNEYDWLEDVQKRNEHVVKKYVEGFSDLGPDEREGKIGNVENLLDVEKQGLFDIRKAKPFKEEDYAKMEQLEINRREIMGEVNITKSQLMAVYKYETFNELTGIGETRHGLPLGRLSVKIVELQEFKDEHAVKKNQKVRVRVLIKGHRQRGPPAGPPKGPNSDTATRKLDNDGRIVFNQVMGPYAPIRTQDADVVFEIIDMSQKNAADVSLATASVKLRDLLDQKTHNEVINLQFREDDGTLRPSEARLFVSLLFMYSKVVPIRNKLYALQDRVRQIDRQIGEIKDRKEPMRKDSGDK